MRIHTIGHSTRSLDDMIKILQNYRIEILVDIRHFPRSRHNPQFNKERLEEDLQKSKINYTWLESLGGFRKGGYKNFMRTKEFRNGIEELMKISGNKAIMCAEILYFRCHRRYVADRLKRKGHEVVHIYDEKKAEKHRLFKKKIRCD